MNWASYPQAERTSDTRSSHFLSTTESKKIFIEWIWLGKILANGVQFAKVLPRQNFALYGSFPITDIRIGYDASTNNDIYTV